MNPSVSSSQNQPRPIRKVCIYCASSKQAHPEYYQAATRLGRLLAERDIAIVYGGGASGAMGALADGALAAGGRVIGVMPEFMHDLEWGHPGLAELKIVDGLHSRKRLMMDGADAIIALPGGSGTLEELFEAISWKRLGLFLNPIVIVNVRRYFDPLKTLLDHSLRERFMDNRHSEIWSFVDSVDDVIQAIIDASPWSEDARGFAAI